MSIALRAATKLGNQPETITPDFLASAIKLAALSTNDQDELTSATVTAAIKFANKASEQETLTTDSLATALKFVSKLPANEEQNSTDEELITPDLLSDALQLAKQ